MAPTAEEAREAVEELTSYPHPRGPEARKRCKDTLLGFIAEVEGEEFEPEPAHPAVAAGETPRGMRVGHGEEHTDNVEEEPEGEEE